MKLRYPACSKAKGSEVRQGLTIFDFTHGSVTSIGKQAYKMIKLASTVASDNYPEISGKMFVVNTPMLFKGVWSIVKGFIDEKTRKKITILRSSF
jgi:hypothetical protein